jgi:hypothetical protein
MSQAWNPEHISSILQVSGCSHKDITRVSSATEKSETDVKRRVSKWDHRAYVPDIQCTVVHSIRLLGRIHTVHKPQNKMMTSLKSISNILSVTQEPDVGEVPWNCGRVCMCLTWCHIFTRVAEHVGDTSLQNQWSAVATHPTASVRVDTDWVKCGLTSVPANLLFNQWVSSCWIVPCSTHTPTHVASFTLKMVTPVCTEMLEQLWHVTCLNLKLCYMAQCMRRYVCWFWPLTTSLFFFVIMCPFLYMNCCFILLSSNNTVLVHTHVNLVKMFLSLERNFYLFLHVHRIKDTEIICVYYCRNTVQCSNCHVCLKCMTVDIMASLVFSLLWLVFM